MTIINKRIFQAVSLLLLSYVIAGIAVYRMQELFLFHPEPLNRTHQYAFADPHRDLDLMLDKESIINIIQFSCPEGVPVHGVVLYFHGNRQNIGYYAHYAKNFTKNGWEVWMLDYPGFGKSTGPFNEKRLYEYAGELYALAQRTFAPGQIIIYGKSMGTGIAAELASRKSCSRLILETPYYSMSSLAAHYFPMYPVSQMIRYKLPTYQYIEVVNAPISIFHGTDDGVIPYGNSKKLLRVLKERDEYISIEGGGHNDLDDFPLFRKKLDSLLALH